MRRLYLCILVCATVSVVVTLAAQSNSKPITIGRSICVPYDPASLRLVEVKRMGDSDWQLMRGDGAIFRIFAVREDAEEGLAIAKQHSQLCYIGKSNTRPNRTAYIMEYWK